MQVHVHRAVQHKPLAAGRCIACKPAAALDVRHAIAVASVLLLSPASFAAEPLSSSGSSNPTENTAARAQAPSGPTSMSFTVVSKSVSAKIQERDENMAWKCNGVNMYDCDGERAEAADKMWQDLRSNFKTSSNQ